jgi:mono/diheme cytochrome c family protein
MRRWWALGAVVMAATACGHDFEPPDPAERVRRAEGRYSPEMFDTVTWASDSARTVAGNTVYAEKCRRCHGALGAGGTEYARERGLEVPSLVMAEPPFDMSLDSLRWRIFTGHASGMPTFGIAGISPRDIDSSAFYLVFTLRPDVLGTGG